MFHHTAQEALLFDTSEFWRIGSVIINKLTYSRIQVQYSMQSHPKCECDGPTKLSVFVCYKLKEKYHDEYKFN